MLTTDPSLCYCGSEGYIYAVDIEYGPYPEDGVVCPTCLDGFDTHYYIEVL